MLSVEESLVNYARHWADYYNEAIGSFRPELKAGAAEALDSILYDMVTLKYVVDKTLTTNEK